MNRITIAAGLLCARLYRRRRVRPMLPSGAVVIALMCVGVNTAPAQSRSTAEMELSKALSDLGQAYLTADIDALERLLADDYTLVERDGDLVPKHEIIDAVSKRISVVQAWSERNVKIRVYGSTAIATGIVEMQQRVMGKDTSGRFRFTRVLIKDSGQWRFVATQVTRVPLTR